MWLLQPPESPQRETGRRGGGGRVDCAIRRSGLTHRQVCRERRFRRDRGGATGTVAANPGFCVRDGSPPGRRQLRWLRSRQPPRQGDARKRHCQENNKTESNQSSRKKKNSSRNNNIISNRQMTGLKRQKPTAERPRNERGGASARPLSAPPARGLFPARADGH